MSNRQSVRAVRAVSWAKRPGREVVHVAMHLAGSPGCSKPRLVLLEVRSLAVRK